MAESEFDLSAPELAPEDLLWVDDPYFTDETVAVVSGAASGIGRATAVALAANGLTVVGADIDERGYPTLPTPSRGLTSAAGS